MIAIFRGLRIRGLVIRKVLVVDDEPDMVSTCVRLLKRQGYDCLTAQNGPEAIRLINDEHPDLVVTDLQLSVGERV